MLQRHSIKRFLDCLDLIEFHSPCQVVELDLLIPGLDLGEDGFNRLVLMTVALVEHQIDVQVPCQVRDIGSSMT